MSLLHIMQWDYYRSICPTSVLEFHWNLGAGAVTRAIIKPQPRTAAEDYSVGLSLEFL